MKLLSKRAKAQARKDGFRIGNIYRLKPQPSEYDAAILKVAKELVKRASEPLAKEKLKSYSDDAKDRAIDVIVACQRLEEALDRDDHMDALKHFADMVRADLGRRSTVNTASSKHPRPRPPSEEEQQARAIYEKMRERGYLPDRAANEVRKQRGYTHESSKRNLRNWVVKWNRPKKGS